MTREVTKNKMRKNQSVEKRRQDNEVSRRERCQPLRINSRETGKKKERKKTKKDDN